MITTIRLIIAFECLMTESLILWFVLVLVFLSGCTPAEGARRTWKVPPSAFSSCGPPGERDVEEERERGKEKERKRETAQE